jgi:Leucine-rich repeat (LRR) protein
LDVSNNLLVRLATGGDNHLPATLESLDVSCNNLMRICGLDKCMDLKRLNLASNKLKTVTGLEFLASLR